MISIHRKESSIDQMKTVTSERCNTHNLYLAIKHIPKIVNINHTLHYDAAKKNDAEQTFR